MRTRISISAYDLPARDLLELAIAADRAGFDTVWLGEHLVLPMAYESQHPTTDDARQHQQITGPIISPETELLEPLVELGAAAGATSHLGLATGMYLLALRHPLQTARAAATLHEVSGGRFRLGIGVGWLREEFDAFGVPFAERVARVTEIIEILRQAWTGGPFEHHSRFFSIDRVQVTPRAVTVPLVLGGNSERALRRAAALGDAWFASGTPSFDDAMRLRDRLQQLRTEVGSGADLPCSVRIAGRDPAVVDRYRQEGMDEVVIWADQLWPSGTSEVKQLTLTGAAIELGLAPRDG